MAKLIWAIIFGLLPFSLSLAQKYDYNWTFADSCGIDFTDTTNPKPFRSLCKRDGSSETQATISNRDGKLIAYWAFDTLDSNNRTYFSNLLDHNHKLIKNGNNIWVNGIFGSGAIFIPFPNDSSKYYFFSIASIKGDQKTACQKIGCTIFYAVLQVFSNERIEIIQKNQVLLEGEFSDHLAAVRHANGRDWWLLAHESISNRFIRFIITPNGITSPAYQAIGRGPTLFHLNRGICYWRGDMVISPKGNRLCIGAGNLDLLELYRFNRFTGLLSDLVVLGSSSKLSDDKITLDYYGISFSEDESKLYISLANSATSETKYSLYQYDLSNTANILQSQTMIFEGYSTFRTGIQELGPDGKIYIAQASHSSLSVINKPNEKFPDCDFVKDGFFLQGKQSRYGLPSFPVFRVPTLPIPAGRIEVTLPDCPEEARVIGKQDYKFYVWDDGSNEDLRYIDYKPGVSKYIRWSYDLEDTLCAVRCDTFYVTFRPAYLRISTSQSRQICQDDSIRIGDNQQCDSCYYRWLPRTSLTNSNAKQTVAKPNQTTTYVRSTYIPNGCVVGTDTVFIRVIEKHVPPCTSVSRPEIKRPKTVYQLYPNPANDQVNVEYQVPMEECATLEIYEASGIKIIEYRLQGESGLKEISTQTWAEGVYLFRFSCGNHIRTQKLFISR